MAVAVISLVDPDELPDFDFEVETHHPDDCDDALCDAIHELTDGRVRAELNTPTLQLAEAF